jgi:ADP-ribosylglycohydrolase
MMSLFNLLSLDDQDIDLVTGVVKSWCERNHVASDSECGHAAMAAAVNRVAAGENAAEALIEAITIAMCVEHYKSPPP